MDDILTQLKLKNQPPPMVWNLSVEITQKIVGQKEEFPNLQNNYDLLKEKHQIAKRLSGKAYVENCVQENKKQINELENLVGKLKEKLQIILNEKKKIQDKIDENEKKKRESEKMNRKLISEIEKVKAQISKIESSIEGLDSKINEQDDIIESLNNTFQAEQRITRLITQMMNKSKKVHFPEAFNGNNETIGRSLERVETAPRFITRPNFSNQLVSQRPLSFSGTRPLKHHKTESKISIQTGTHEAMPFLPNGCITSIAFCKTGKIFATGSEDNIISIYEYGQGYPFESIKMEKSIVSLDFNSSDNLLLVACYDMIRIFDFNNYSLHVRPDKIIIKKVYHSEFISPDKFAVCSENYAIRVYKVTKKGAKLKASLRSKISSMVSWICSGTVSSDFAAGYESGTIRIWDPHSSKIIFENCAHQCAIIQILCYESTFVSLSTDGCVAFTNMLSNVVERKIYLKGCPLHEKSRIAIFNKSLLIGGDDGIIHEYSLKDGKFITKWENFHDAPITSISANKSYVVSGDKNGKIKVWLGKSNDSK